MKEDKILIKNKKMVIIWSVILAIFILYLKETLQVLGFLFQVLEPVMLGFLFSLILKTPMLFFENKLFYKLKRKKEGFCRILSVSLSYGLLILMILIVIEVVPELILSLSKLIQRLPELILALLNGLNKVLVILDLPKFDPTDLSKVLIENINKIVSNFILKAPDIIKLSTKGIAFLSNLFFSIAFSLYILIDKEGIKTFFKKILSLIFPKNVANKILYYTEKTIISFDNFISGQLVESIILGILCFFGMLILRLPYPVLISSIVAVTAIIPIVGAFLGTVPGLILIMIESPIQGLIFLSFICILQIVEGNIIYPFVVGNKVKLPPFLVLLSIMIGGGIFGVIGILLAVPIFSVIYNEI